MLAFSLVVSATASPLIKDCSFSMILFWVAMRSSISRKSVAIFVCSTLDGMPIKIKLLSASKDMLFRHLHFIIRLDE